MSQFNPQGKVTGVSALSSNLAMMGDKVNAAKSGGVGPQVMDTSFPAMARHDSLGLSMHAQPTQGIVDVNGGYNVAAGLTPAGGMVNPMLLRQQTTPSSQMPEFARDFSHMSMVTPSTHVSANPIPSPSASLADLHAAWGSASPMGVVSMPSRPWLAHQQSLPVVQQQQQQQLIMQQQQQQQQMAQAMQQQQMQLNTLMQQALQSQQQQQMNMQRSHVPIHSISTAHAVPTTPVTATLAPTPSPTATAAATATATTAKPASSSASSAGVFSMLRSQAADLDVVDVATPGAQANTTAGSMGMMGMNDQSMQELLSGDNPKWRNSKFLNFISKLRNGDIEFKDNEVVPVDPMERLARARASMAGEEWMQEEEDGEEEDGIYGDSSAAKEWARQFRGEGAEEEEADQAQGDEEEEEYYDEEQRSTEAMWKELLQNQDLSSQSLMDALEKAREKARQDPPYEFDKTDNPFAKESSETSFAKGLELIEAGYLQQAILAFEAAVQEEPDNAEAWRWLGLANAQNENEGQALAALHKCVSIDPYNLPALLQLGVSHCNELNEARALKYLRTWMSHNPEYMDHIDSSALEEYEQYYGATAESDRLPGVFDTQYHAKVAEIFVQASQINPKDVDVWTVLGVLYHISNDYDKAAEAFKNATRLRPDDAQLWNKLGATHANFQHPAEAEAAYMRALSLRPNYLRAQSNLAIAYYNQKKHDLAAKAFLRSLTLDSNHSRLWSYLRMSLSFLGRDDLVKLCESRDPSLFKEHIEF